MHKLLIPFANMFVMRQHFDLLLLFGAQAFQQIIITRTEQTIIVHTHRFNLLNMFTWCFFLFHCFANSVCVFALKTWKLCVHRMEKQAVLVHFRYCDKEATIKGAKLCSKLVCVRTNLVDLFAFLSVRPCKRIISDDVRLYILHSNEILQFDNLAAGTLFALCTNNGIIH